MSGYFGHMVVVFKAGSTSASRVNNRATRLESCARNARVVDTVPGPQDQMFLEDYSLK
jgi:hypothetical protein